MVAKKNLRVPRSVCSICRDPLCGGRDFHRLIGFRSSR